MNHFKQSLLCWLSISAGITHLLGDGPRPGDPEQVWQQSVPRLSAAQHKDAEIIRLNLNYGGGVICAGVAYQAAVSRDMLIKANWLVNRLNLPIKRPIYTTDVRTWCIPYPALAALRQPMPSPYPDTVFGSEIYNTNFSRLQRILALKFAVNGVLDTPAFEFSFNDGQLGEIVRRDASQGKRYVDRLTERMSGPAAQTSADKIADVYQLATNWLAAVNVNPAMLEKSRLPHPVHEAQYRLSGSLLPQPVYFVDWGTNYYDTYWLYHFWHTNEWHPQVSVEIGPHKELLEMYIGDPTLFHDPPMLIPSKTVWRLVHTPDPPLSYLQTPTGMREFVMTPDEVSDYASHATNRLWLYQHHQLDPASTMLISNELKRISSELIPYTPDS